MHDAAQPPAALDELLAHRAFLRSLARALTRDVHEADDLEQDTWERALRATPAATHSPRGWLATVLRNRRVDTVRSDVRRGAREEHVRSAATAPSAAEVAARAELQRHVLATVLALEPHHRDVVLLRFFEGLEPAEIAPRLGLEPTTVRTRLHRALAQLRGRLDAAEEPRHRAWRAALVPLATARPGDAPDDATPWRSIRRALAVTCVGALVVAAAFVARALVTAPAPAPAGTPPVSHDTTSETPPVADDGAATEPRRRVHIDAAAPGPEETPEPAAVPESPATTPALTVTVRDADGGVVSGAQFQLLDADSFAKTGFAAVLAEGPCDAEGRAAFERVLVSEFRVIVRADTRAALTPVFERDAAPAAVTLTLEAAAALRGTLVATSGEPVAGARLELMLTGDVFGPGGIAVTDAQGRFAFATLPLSAFASSANLALTARGFPATDRQVARDELLGAGIRIELEPALTLRGRCVDAAGAPVAGVDVSCAATSRPATTGADGTFVLDGVPPAAVRDGKADVLLEPEAHAARRIHLEPSRLADDGDLGDIVLAPGATLRGRVVDESGAPAPGAHVHVTSDELRQTIANVSADASGVFEIAHVGPGTHDVEAVAPCDETFAGTSGVARGVRAGDEVVVTVSGRGTLLVEFVEADGTTSADVVDVVVVLEPLADDGDEDGCAFSTEDAFHAVRLRPAAPGAYRLTVRTFVRPDVVHERVEIAAERETRVRVTLPSPE